MARNISPSCRLCRREGEKLFLKGSRCESQKCAIVRRNYPPGVHGQTRARRPSDYGLQLREKQKAKRTYGVLEKQFRRYYDSATKGSGVTGDLLVGLLERRLDSVVYRCNIAESRKLARQIVRHNHLLVNGKRQNLPSYLVKQGDKITVKESGLKSNYFKEQFPKIKPKKMPSWITYLEKDKKFVIDRLPEASDADQSLKVQMIVEFYSR